MSFVDSIKTVLGEKYATFTGRARRSEYWWFWLASFIVTNVLQRILLPADYYQQISDGTYQPGAGASLLSLISLALLIPSFAVAVRRLHDTGTSGHYLWLLLLILIGWIMLIVRLAKEGDVGENKYGPDPRA